MLTHYMHRAPSLLFVTLIMSFDSLDLHIQVYGYLIVDQIFGEVHSHEEVPGVISLHDYQYSYFCLFMSFLLIPYIRRNACSIPLFICYHMWIFMYYYSGVSDYIPYSDYFRLSVYTWGILLVYIRRRLLSRLCFHVFWEAGRDSFTWSKQISRSLFPNCPL